MAEQGVKQVSVIGQDDKREITVLLAITLSGQMLPPQLLYAGKTDKCHPSTTFPEDWDIFHSPNHWSNEDTMLRYLDKIVIPYVSRVREQMGKPDQKALVICDVFAAHRTQDVKAKLDEANMERLFVPAGCTGQLQPLDVAVNDQFKMELKQKFSSWYSSKVEAHLRDNSDLDTFKVDLRSSVLKPVHANWLISVINDISKRADTIVSGFAKSGILDAFPTMAIEDTALTSS